MRLGVRGREDDCTVRKMGKDGRSEASGSGADKHGVIADYCLRVVAPHFVAGVECRKSRDGEPTRIVYSAPILRWAIGKDVEDFTFYAASKGWEVAEVWHTTEL